MELERHGPLMVRVELSRHTPVLRDTTACRDILNTCKIYSADMNKLVASKEMAVRKCRYKGCQQGVNEDELGGGGGDKTSILNMS